MLKSASREGNWNTQGTCGDATRPAKDTLRQGASGMPISQGAQTCKTEDVGKEPGSRRRANIDPEGSWSRIHGLARQEQRGLGRRRHALVTGRSGAKGLIMTSLEVEVVPGRQIFEIRRWFGSAIRGLSDERALWQCLDRGSMSRSSHIVVLFIASA